MEKTFFNGMKLVASYQEEADLYEVYFIDQSVNEGIELDMNKVSKQILEYVYHALGPHYADPELVDSMKP